MSEQLTREQVDNMCYLIRAVSIHWPVRIAMSRSIRDHVAAQRARIEALEQDQQARIAALHTLRTGYDATVAQLEARLAQRDAELVRLLTNANRWNMLKLLNNVGSWDVRKFVFDADGTNGRWECVLRHQMDEEVDIALQPSSLAPTTAEKKGTAH